jgi:hypothetical protein
MKTIHVLVDDDRYLDIKELSLKTRSTMSGLFRYALDRTFEDELDIIGGERGLAEARENPGSTISLTDLVAQIEKSTARGGPRRPSPRRSVFDAW